jgi:tetratricopeptide (TPR) repeat protein
MNFKYLFPTGLMGLSIALVQPQSVLALTSSEVSKIAESITVRIELTNSKSQGSGVIIKREGNTYTVITAHHVVGREGSYKVFTPDGSSYPLESSQIQKIGTDLDLAVFKFTSNKTYNVAKMGDSAQSATGTDVYVAGFPIATSAVNVSLYRFTKGEITANASQPLADGYGLVYSNATLNGMSGGPVINEKGELVGIHGKAETTANQDKQIIRTGFNLGIPINRYTRESSTTVASLPPRTTTNSGRTTTNSRLTADDYFLQGKSKSEKGEYQAAFRDLSEAIKINPEYAEAYASRAQMRYNQGDFQGAIQDYDRAIDLNPNNSLAYNGRGLTKFLLEDTQGAIADYNQAISLDSKSTFPFNNRANAKAKLGDTKGAIQDYNRAIELDPTQGLPYANRGSLRMTLGDKKGATADFNQAIRISPNSGNIYGVRGIARYRTGDKRGALADLDKATQLEPNLGFAHGGKAIVRLQLADYQGSIKDFNTAIRLMPDVAYWYIIRGIAYFQIENNSQAEADWDQGAEIAQKQGNDAIYKQVQDIKKITELPPEQQKLLRPFLQQYLEKLQ